jgi:autotransporter-associated beta strand protein
MSNCASIPLQNTGKYVVMDKCVVKSYTSPVFDFTNFNQNNAITITNTIFWGNSTTIFPAITANRNSIIGTVFNSTFYNNTTVNADNPGSSETDRTLKIHNSIFNSNSSNITGTYLKAVCTYNLTNESSGWGTGSVYSISSPGFNNASPTKASDFGLQSSSAAIDKGTSTGAPTTDIAGTTRSGSYDIGAWEGSGGGGSSDYTWDINNSTSGFQGGSGTWSTSNSNWGTTGGSGTSLVVWPGAGNSATFAGGTGTYTITVSNTVYVDSITFIDNTYTLQSGTAINFGTKKGIYVASGKTAIINTPVTGTGGITKTGSGILYITGTSTYSGNTTISAGAFSVGAGSTTGAVSGNITANDTLFFNHSDNYTFSGDISGTGALYKYGSGSLILTGACTHTGGTQNLYGTGISIGSGSTSGNLTGNVYGDKSITFNRSDSYTFSGAINGTCAITKSAANTLILTGTNTTTGGITISGGTLQIGNNGTTGAISNSCNITDNAALTFYRSDAYAYGGNISGSGSVTKNGAGATTLSGNHTYSGTTTVSAGSLLINGSTASGSAVTVSSGGTLEGTGTVGGTVSVSGTLYPGTSGIGTLSIGNNCTFSSGSALTISANSATAGAYGCVSQTGTFAPSGYATFTLNLLYAAIVGDTFLIVDNDGGDVVSGTFSGLAQGDTVTSSYNGMAYKSVISYTGGTGNDIVLRVARITQGEEYTEWSYSRTISLNTTSQGADVSGNVTNFPVLLRLNPDNFPYFSQTLASGADIRFAKTNGNHLRYTIERWVDVTGSYDTAEIWIKIDTVYGNNKTQAFVMYWGKTGAADSSKSTAVFDTANGFVSVYSLGQSSGAAVDYTYNALNGTANGNVPNRQAGQIGYGQSFDGDGDYFNAGAGTKFDLSANDRMTISAWVKPAGNATGGIEGIVAKWRWNGATAYQYELAEDQTNGFFFGLSSTGSDYIFLYDSVGNAPSNDTWYNVVGQMDGSKMRIFVDGVAKDSTNATAIAPENSNASFKIGEIDDDGSTYRQYYNGIIDYVTLSKTARNADWIKLSYENQKTDQTLVDPEDFTTWDHSGNIKINTSGITSSNCYGFPLLIRLTSSNFYFSEAQSSGQDIRFAKSDGTALPYQIERWDNANSYAEIWVRVDTIFANNSSQYIVMYWGKNYVASKSSGTAVFNSTNGFMGSWHYGGDVTDATEYNTTTNYSSVDTSSGIIGKARAFNGSSQYMQLGDIADRSSGTISFWMRPKAAFGSSTTTSQGIWGKTEGDGYNSTLALRGTEYLLGDGSTGCIQNKIENNNTSVYVSGTTTSFSAGTWYYVTWNFGSSSCSMYLNGTSQKTTGSSQTIAGNVNDEVGRAYFDNGNISGGGPRYFNGTLDEFRIESDKRSADWIKLCYQTQKSDQSIIALPGNYTWDTSTDPGIQPASGTWSAANNNWTFGGTTLIGWPGAGSSAIFAGGTDAGSYTITVSSTQYVDSITFSNSGYTLSSGTVNLGTKKGIYLLSGKTATINSVIAGTGGLSVRSASTLATLTLGGSNTYTGVTTIGAYTRLNATSLANGGTASPLGASSNAAANLIIDGGQLRLSSGSSSTDKLFTATANGACIYSSGSGAMNFTNAGSIAFSGSGSRIIEFGGAYAGTNTFAPIIGDGSGGATSILKTGTASTWVFTGNNTFTGAVTISTGILRAGSASAFGNASNAITVSNTAAIDINGYNLQTYTGITINGTLLSNYGTIYNSGAEQQNAIRQITLGSDASIGNDGNRFDIGRGYTGNRIFGGGYTLTKIGTGTVAFAADATNLGGLVINGGTIILETNTSAGSAPITIGASGTLSSDGSRTFTNQLTFSSGGTITTPNNASYTTAYNGTVSASGTATLNTVTTNTLSFGGVISGTGTINKSGSGTVILSNSNTYSGSMNVNAGTLRVTGSTASGGTVAVSSGATLTGTGNVQGGVTIANGGIVSPGISGAGTLTTGALALNNTSVLNFDLGTTSDTIKVNGNLTLDGTINITLTTGPGSYTIMTYTGTLTDNSLSFGTVPSGYTYSVSTGNGKVIVDIISRKLLPITVKHNIGTGTSDTCLVYTDEWSLIFDEDDGGQIKFLSKLPNGAGTNQMCTGTQRNMFSVVFNQGSYNLPGVLKILEIGPVHIIIQASYTLNSVTFTEEYTVYGSGQIFLKVQADNRSGSSQTQALSFLCFRDEKGSAVRKTSSATASACTYLFNAENSDTSQFDIIMSLYNPWTSATGFISSTSDYSCLGITGNSYLFANGDRRIWEFMLDFASKTFNDTSASTNQIVNDYRNPDSLVFFAGTPGMEQTWEHHLYGHWKFDESSGDTARDNSTSNLHAYTTGTFTTSGKWGNGLQLNGSQSATVAHNTSLNGDSRFTVMAWIKVASFGASAVVISKHNGTSGWKLSGNATNKVTLQLDGTLLSGVTNVADNQWHHIAANFTTWENEVAIFVDGKIDAFYPAHYTTTATASNLTIGSGLTGTIDDIRYYAEHVSESTLKSIYQLGYRSAAGTYHLRANNDNTVHFTIDGSTYHHSYPSLTIENYWATTKPAAGCVVCNGIVLTENTGYYAYLDDGRNTLRIVLNKTISSDGITIYIDDNNTDGYQMVGAAKKMSWGVNTVGTNQYVWAKNFPSDTFGSNTSNQWYANWNMSRSGSSNPHRDGEIWYMASSVEKANTKIDTTSSNLIPGSNVNAYYSTLGNFNFIMNSYQVRTSESVSNAFTFQIAESSSVRVRLRTNERQVSLSGQSYRIVTENTIYPTGQIFRYDSLYQFSSAPTAVYVGWFMRDQTNATVYTNKTRKCGAVLYSSGYPDFATAWLGMKNASGYQAQPFDSDTMNTTSNAYRVGFNFTDLTLSSLWNSTSIETAEYIDMQTTSMTTSFVDSASRSVQNIGLAGGAALAIIEGTLAKNSTGDLDTNGFNEREGAYILDADNNTVNFKLPARHDTCRYSPAFKIRKYYASRKPNYVFGYNSSDTTVFLDGYQYNAYLNSAARELVMQFDSVFCDSVGIYISADKTLAVTISEFFALAGILSDTIRWQTESEQENLGFHLYRRIRPAFVDSIKNVIKNSSPQANIGRAGALVKSRAIDTTDTQWVKITNDLIPGAPAGASFGPRKYEFVDCIVYDSLMYEYRLKAIDFENRNRMYGPVKAMPFALIKYVFKLGRNYPNPFTGYTVIQFTLPEKISFSLDIYDLQGRLVRQLIRKDKPYNAGMHRVIWDGTNSSGRRTAAGTYIYHLNSKKYKKAFTMLYTGR